MVAATGAAAPRVLDPVMEQVRPGLLALRLETVRFAGLQVLRGGVATVTAQVTPKLVATKTGQLLLRVAPRRAGPVSPTA